MTLRQLNKLRAETRALRAKNLSRLNERYRRYNKKKGGPTGPE